MKHSVNFFLLICFCFSLSTSCYRDPISSFVVDIALADVGQTVTFSNTSLFASKQTWDFGDGSASNNPSIGHVYDAPGNYIVTLTVEQKNGPGSAVSSQIVHVGERYASIVNVANVPLTKSGGATWDTDLGNENPDIVFAMRPSSSGSWVLETPVNENMLDPSPPFFWALMANPIFSDTNWEWELRDMDSGTFEIIASGTLNPYADGQDNIIPITDTGLSMNVAYELQEVL